MHSRHPHPPSTAPHAAPRPPRASPPSSSRWHRRSASSSSGSGGGGGGGLTPADKKRTTGEPHITSVTYVTYAKAPSRGAPHLTRPMSVPLQTWLQTGSDAHTPTEDAAGDNSNRHHTRAAIAPRPPLVPLTHMSPTSSSSVLPQSGSSTSRSRASSSGRRSPDRPTSISRRSTPHLSWPGIRDDSGTSAQRQHVAMIDRSEETDPERADEEKQDTNHQFTSHPVPPVWSLPPSSGTNQPFPSSPPSTHRTAGLLSNPVPSSSSHLLRRPSDPEPAVNRSIDVTLEEFGRQLAIASREVAQEDRTQTIDETQQGAAPPAHISSTTHATQSIETPSNNEPSLVDLDDVNGGSSLPRENSDSDSHEESRSSSSASSASGSSAAAVPPRPSSTDPASMKLSHRLIIERLYGTARADEVVPISSPVSSSVERPQTTPSTRSRVRHVPKLIGLSDGLPIGGSMAMAGGRTRPAPTPLAALTALTARPATSHSTYLPSVSQPVRSARRRAALTARSATPRVTQASNVKRLTSGQSVATSRLEGDEKSDASAWTFLTGVRKTRERVQRIREARMHASNASRSDVLQPPPELTLEEQELEKQAQMDSAKPLYQRQGIALPSAKKSRRPPAQSSFREVSLADGVLSKVVRAGTHHYRLSAAIPGSLTLAHDPRLVAWRLDTNAWLSHQQKYVSKQVSMTQMSELRVLYDALDDDGSESLDIGELATAMKVCGMRDDDCRDIASSLLEWMGKTRFECLSFAEFAYAVMHYEIPVSRRPGSQRAAFGAAQRMESLFNKMMRADSRANFSQVVLEFKRHRLYSQMQKATGTN